jgi:hypothetical protein
MKKSALFIVTVFALLALSCKKDEVTTNFDTSLQTWQTFKTSTNNSYRYATKSVSVFGLSDSTAITVVNGKVTNRDYVRFRLEYKTINTPPTKTITLQWNETAVDLGSHHNQGFNVYTMDEVYTTTKNVWLAVDKKDNILYFETKNNGLISLAGYRPKGCEDDCFVGITITSVTKL